MAYIDPQTVWAPRDHIRSVDVLYNGGPGAWSAALLNYDGEERVGVRWNGEEGAGIGNPQSRARPTWFIAPPELAALVRERAEELSNMQEGGLLAGYREMADDRERDAEAQEWIEALIGDGTHQEG
jgi:hypothetical protein